MAATVGSRAQPNDRSTFSAKSETSPDSFPVTLCPFLVSRGRAVPALTVLAAMKHPGSGIVKSPRLTTDAGAGA